jgi:uncharacterized protein (TIGR02266 family)
MAEQLYNSRILDTYLQLIKLRYPHVDVTDILSYAGLETYEVADQASWFSQEQINRFYQRCTQLTGNENIAREAGRFAASPGTLGVLRQYTLGLLGPLKTFALIGKTTTKSFTRSSEYVSRQLGDNLVELTVTPHPGIQEEAFQCQNRLGFFEAIVTIFNLSAPEIEHPDCIFEGGSCCRYLIRWREVGSRYFRKLRNFFAMGALAANLVMFPFIGLPWGIIVSLASLSALLLLQMRFDFSTRQELLAGMTHLWDSSEQLTEQVDRNYRNTQLTREVGEVIASKTSISEVLESVTLAMQKTLDYDRGLILLADQTNQWLEIRGAYGYIEQHLDLLSNIAFRLDNPQSKGVFVVSFREQKPFLINNASEIAQTLSPKSQDFLRALGTQSFICMPIVLESKSIGILAVDNLQTKKPLVASDINLLLGIAQTIAISIQNARLLETRAAQFDSTLQVLADSIDARDFLTAGHSEKVAEYAVAIAEELNLSEEFCRVIRTAALLHDYGKIGIPDSILKKDGPLTEEERAVIRTHPTKSKQILDKVSFEGAFREIPEIVYAHHERWDGAGYPNALRGEKIPLGARIIATADFFEAITAKRHYRNPMLTDQAIRELRDESGRYFQPEIVTAFLRYLEHNKICMLDDPDGTRGGTGGGTGGVTPNQQTAPQRTQRIPYRTEVSASIAMRTISGTCVNIGQGGLFINSPEADQVLPGTEVSITFALPQAERLVKLNGKVAWVNKIKQRSTESLPQGFGVQFAYVDPDIRQHLDEYINYQLGTAGPTQLFH